MVTSEEELALAYLLDPCFQIVNSAGKPLTDGYIEVYYHGTRTKYYCYSDWNGSLHPHKIPLDSLGANIVLASPDFAYDVYVYNKFGSLIMSRYNVTPGQGGGGSGGIPSQYEAEHWLGQYGATQALIGNQTGQTLALPSRPDYQGDFVDHIDYGYINGDETNEYPKYMYLKPGLYLVNCVIRFQQQSGTEVNRLDETLVYTGNGNANEDVAWQLDETGPLTTTDRHCLKLTFIRKVLDEGETSPVDCSNILYFAPGPSVNWNDAYIQTLQIVKLNSAVQGGGGAMMLKPGPGISIDEEAVISVTGMQPVSGMDQYVTVNYFGDTITNVTGDIYNIVSGVTGDINDVSEVVNNVTGDITEITNVVNNVTGDVTEITNIVNGVTGDIEQLNTDIQAVSAALPDAQIQSDWDETDPESKAYIQNKPDLSVYATHSEVTGDIQNVTSVINQEIINITGDIQSVSADAQVQSDWTENDSSDLAYIKNKPEEVTLVAGENVTLTRSGTNLTISAAGGDLSNYATVSGVAAVSGELHTEIQAVSAAVPDAQVQADWDESDPDSKAYIQNKPDLTQYATQTEVSTVTGTLESEIQSVSGAMPDPQVQSDWAQTDNAEVDYIKNKPDMVNLIAGQNIGIELNGNDLTISASGTDISGVTGDIATLQTEVAAVTGDIQSVSAAIPPAQIQSNWTEADSASKAYIQNKPTEMELVAGTGLSMTTEGSTVTLAVTGGGSGGAEYTGVSPIVVDNTTHQISITGDVGVEYTGASGISVDNENHVIAITGDVGKTYTGASGVTVDNENDIVALEAPVDVVAGPGIVIDNPDGNTLRISAEADAETVLWETTGSDFTASGSVVNFSENPTHFEKLKFIAWSDEMAPIEVIIYPDTAKPANISWFQIANNQFRIWDTIVYITSTGMTAGQAVMAIANATSTGNNISTNQINWTWNYRLIKKVIGIHRIANN